MSDHQPAVARHYGRGGLLERILGALTEAGKDIEHLTIDDLAPVDEFHGRQRRATEELAAMLAPPAGARLLDIGSGIGGPSRYLAKMCGCRVSGVDLTEEFVAAANDLTRRAGLTGQVDFRQGSALDLPFPDASFDLAWSQNVAMNIFDRPRWYAEVHRVLRPGGRFAFQDVAQGPAGPVHFPVPWSDTPALSFLRTAEDTRAMLEAAGFTVVEWRDTSEASIAEFEAQRAQAAANPAANPGARPALGINLVVGADFLEKMKNSQRSLRENRTRLINAVVARG
jgi:SAM-dependent methyltransferase